MHNHSLKILVINYEYPPIGGGGGVICRDFAEEFAAAGHQVTVITSKYGRLLSRESVNRIDIHRIPVAFRKKVDTASIPSMLSFVPSSILYAKREFNDQKFDIINTHFAIPSGPVGHFIASHFQIPNVLSIHGGDIFDPSKSLSPHHTIGLKQTVRKMLNSADRVVAQSSDTRNNAITYYNISREIDIIPLGIRQNPYQNKSRKEMGLPEDDFVFSTIGRLIKRKNIPVLIKIFKKVHNLFPCKLIIIGDGPEYNNFQQLINDNNLENQIILTGRISDELKFQYLLSSNVYLSTAIHEGFGIVFLEAMECGLPVICYNRGGQVDFLQDGKTGFLVELGDEDLFYKKLIDLLRKQELIKNMGEHNKLYVKKFYLKNLAHSYISIFNQTLHKN